MGAREQSPAWPVVALVASAGGLDAVSTVLGDLPADLGASVIVLIHQDPMHKSLLAEVLGRRTALRVRAAQTGQALVPGYADVIAPGEHLLIDGEGIPLTIPVGKAPPSRPSADLLLATLAMAMQRRAVAVVLSGHGHDAATGATVVHQLGGTVIASDEATSEFFAMPQATIERDGIIDHVVRLGDIGGLLGRIAGDAG